MREKSMSHLVSQPPHGVSSDDNAGLRTSFVAEAE